MALSLFRGSSSTNVALTGDLGSTDILYNGVEYGLTVGDPWGVTDVNVDLTVYTDPANLTGQPFTSFYTPSLTTTGVDSVTYTMTNVPVSSFSDDTFTFAFDSGTDFSVSFEIYDDSNSTLYQAGLALTDRLNFISATAGLGIPGTIFTDSAPTELGTQEFRVTSFDGIDRDILSNTWGYYAPDGGWIGGEVLFEELNGVEDVRFITDYWGSASSSAVNRNVDVEVTRIDALGEFDGPSQSSFEIFAPYINTNLFDESVSLTADTFYQAQQGFFSAVTVNGGPTQNFINQSRQGIGDRYEDKDIFQVITSPITEDTPLVASVIDADGGASGYSDYNIRIFEDVNPATVGDEVEVTPIVKIGYQDGIVDNATEVSWVGEENKIYYLEVSGTENLEDNSIYGGFYDLEVNTGSLQPPVVPGPVSPSEPSSGINNGIEYDENGIIIFNPDPNNLFPPPAPPVAPVAPVAPVPGNEAPSTPSTPAPTPTPINSVPAPTPDPEPLPDVDPVTGVTIRLASAGMYDTKQEFQASRFNVSASSPSELPELVINYVRRVDKVGIFDDFSVANVGAKSDQGARKRLRLASETDADFIYNKRTDKLYFNANGMEDGYSREIADLEVGGYLGKIEFDRVKQGITEEIFDLSAYEVMA